MSQLEKYAELLDRAAQTASAVPQITLGDPALSVEDAYAVQALSIKRRLDQGKRRTGMKMGLTSRANILQVGVDQTTCGRLIDAMLLEEGEACRAGASSTPVSNSRSPS